MAIVLQDTQPAAVLQGGAVGLRDGAKGPEDGAATGDDSKEG